MGDLNHIFFAGVEPPLPRRHPRRDGKASPRRTAGLAPAPGSQPEAIPLDPFLVWLLAQAGLDARQYRATALQRRLPACLRLLRVASPAQARQLLEQTPELRPRALDAVLIGVSEFFRDDAVFEALREQVLPGLLNSRRGLRVYSAGCSQGQELYSLAMLLAEANALKPSDLLGVDCRPQAIAAARAGWFDIKELAAVPAPWRSKYFRREERRAQVAAVLRAQTRWQAADIHSPASGGRWDLILCRNVAIYLESEPALSLWKRLAQSLSPGGVLVTGRAEQPPTELPLRRLVSCVYARTEEKAKL